VLFIACEDIVADGGSRFLSLGHPERTQVILQVYCLLRFGDEDRGVEVATTDRVEVVDLDGELEVEDDPGGQRVMVPSCEPAGGLGIETIHGFIKVYAK